MTLEQSIVLSFLRSQILNTPVSLPQGAENCDWSAALNEARQQSVLLMFFEELSTVEDKVDKKVFSECFSLGCAILANNAKMGHVQKNLNDWLCENETSYVILKGEAAASYYDKPQLRSLGDIDFLVNTQDTKQVKTLLMKQGFQTLEEDHICHTSFYRPGSQLEMHFEVAGMPSGEAREKIINFQKDIFKTATKKDIGGGSFLAPEDSQHALVLLLHMQHHLVGEGLGLRHLCDWAYFIKKTETQAFWEEKLLPFLKEIGLLQFAKIITKLCSLYLGINCPYWAIDADEGVCEALFCEVLEGGNFGRKDSLRTSSEKMITARGKSEKGKGKAYYLHENLKASVREKHPAVKDKKWLFPFLYIYRALRYFWFMIIGKRALFHKSLSQADKRRSLYDKLHIFEVENYER